MADPRTAAALRQVAGRMIEAADFLDRASPILEPVFAERLRVRCGVLDEQVGELWEHVTEVDPCTCTEPRCPRHRGLIRDGKGAWRRA